MLGCDPRADVETAKVLKPRTILEEKKKLKILWLGWAICPDWQGPEPMMHETNLLSRFLAAGSTEELAAAFPLAAAALQSKPVSRASCELPEQNFSRGSAVPRRACAP